MSDVPGGSDTPARPKSRWRRLLSVGFPAAVAAALLGGVLPAIADFGAVWDAVAAMTWLEVSTLVAWAGWNVVTYQFVTMAALPGLRWTQAFVVGQISTAVTNTVPAGSAVGVGVTYALFRSFGFGASAIALASVVTGIWNTFVKLALPVVALVILTIRGRPNPAMVSASLTGLAVLVAAVVLLGLVLRSDRMAQRSGEMLGRAAGAALRPLRRGPITTWGDSFLRFRTQSVDLLRRRWHWITALTLVSHLSLFYLLLLALRHMGVSAQVVAWDEALAAFALIRLVAALPVTPGGIGLVEVGLTGALVVAGGERNAVVAAVLVYRSLSYLLQIPLGGISYAIWKLHPGWTSPPAPPGES